MANRGITKKITQSVELAIMPVWRVIHAHLVVLLTQSLILIGDIKSTITMHDMRGTKW